MEVSKKLFVVGLMLLPLVVVAQDALLTGKVTDNSDGKPLPGVNIQVKGTGVGAITDAEGEYSIMVSVPSSVLVFSFVGYVTQEVAVENKTRLDIALAASVTELSEIVVTGIGVATERRRSPIDVVAVSAKNFVPSAIGSLDQALQGKIAGSQIQLASGEPGAQAYIQLRGLNSLGSAQPIILLDGVQITTMAGLDITNIDHVEVVKGAAAGMLFGAQGANGVIQIFSKRGAKDNRISVAFNTRYIIDEVIKGPHPLLASNHFFDTDANGFIKSSAGGLIGPEEITGTWTDPSITSSDSLRNDKPYKEKLYDHFEQVYRRAHSVSNSLNISGGAEKYDYSLNVNWLLQSNVRFGELDRKNISLNLGAEIVKGLSIRSTTQLQLQDESLQSGNRFPLINTNPYIDLTAVFPNGYKIIKNQNLNGYNPLSEYDWRTRGTDENRIIQNFQLNYSFPRFVTINYKYGVQHWNTYASDIFRSQAGFLEPTDAYWGPSPGTGSVYKQSNKPTYQNSLLTGILNFNFREDFHLRLPLVSTTQFSYDWRKDENSQIWGQATGFPFPPYNLNLGQNKTTGSNESEFITYGYLINQTFTYGELAGISAGFRSDYSSEFGFGSGSEIKPFTFPRGTAYINPSEFFDSGLVSHWKLRGAYGEAGIQPNRYDRQPVYSADSYGSAIGVFNPTIVRNPSLNVQRTKELELGTDLTLAPRFSNEWLKRIDLNFSYWYRKSEDIIQEAKAAPSTGAFGIIDNAISLSSHGYDLSIDILAHSSSKFIWNFGIRLGTAKTRVEKIALGYDLPYGGFVVREGQSLGAFFTQVPLTRLDEKRPDGSDYITPNTVTDYEVASTAYGPLVVNKSTHIPLISDPDDLRISGDSQPTLFGSLINDFTLLQYLQINMQWDFATGHKIYNQTRQWLYRDSHSSDFDMPVTVNNKSGAWVNLYNGLYNSTNPLSWFLEDGSFARLRNFQSHMISRG